MHICIDTNSNYIPILSTNGSIANKIKEVTPELCRVADGRHRRLDRVLEQKPVNQMECEMHYISTKTNGRL